MPQDTMAQQYTAISFAPVQGFIEKSRKLRDLYGASLILAYLSQQIAQAIEAEGYQIISPALINVQEGMPNRILVIGDLNRNLISNTITAAWRKVLINCQEWVELHLDLPADAFCWQQEWEKWHRYTWEVFWGQGLSPNAAMVDLEQRKLKRDWVGINWLGESSSLTGTDAIAWHGLGAFNSEPGRSLNPQETQGLKTFYRQLAWVLDNPSQHRATETPTDDRAIEGRFIAANERLSIPELVKRLITFGPIAKKIGMTQLDEGFTEINRDVGKWTGWFMGDGDQVGAMLKSIGDDTATQQSFSQAMRTWGQNFKESFPKNFGRVIYAGGDDFLGVIYNNELKTQDLVKEAFTWLKQFKQQWKTHQQDINVSMGFVWAANRVPQRDILQHCREAEKLAKQKGRDRITIRVVFNSGQYVQWTCPWHCLAVLDRYSGRDNSTNWTHLYKDWAYLKSRHAIRLQDMGKCSVDRTLAESMLDLYFEGWKQEIPRLSTVVGDSEDAAIVQWVDDLVQVGWQLCSNI
jgi:CRISPR-associated protein Cmr2